MAEFSQRGLDSGHYGRGWKAVGDKGDVIGTEPQERQDSGHTPVSIEDTARAQYEAAAEARRAGERTTAGRLPERGTTEQQAAAKESALMPVVKTFGASKNEEQLRTMLHDTFKIKTKEAQDSILEGAAVLKAQEMLDNRNDEEIRDALVNFGVTEKDRQDEVLEAAATLKAEESEGRQAAK